MELAMELVEALLAGAGTVDGHPIRRFADLPPTVDTARRRPITVDQTHESTVVGERLVVKRYRAGAPPRALAVIAHLVEVGFTGMPRCYAALLHGDAAAALVTEYLPGAVDGWQWCVEAFDEDFGYPLGELTARLHAALATPSTIDPEPVRSASTADLASWADQAGAALGAALALTTGEDGEWLAAAAPALRHDLELPAVSGIPVVRGHGDLHVGQILRWPGGYRFIDFDGNPAAPERAELQPATRDVAQLLTSLDHVAMIVAKTRPVEECLARSGQLRAQLFDGYVSTLDSLGHSGLFTEHLLRPFEVEQECRELCYAAHYLPRWRYAPMGVLRHWYR